MTSFKDDSFGGDTNNDGSTSTPAPGDWNALAINTPTSLNNLVVRYGGALGTAMLNINTAATITNLEVSSSAAQGMIAQNGVVTLSSAVIAYNGSDSGLNLFNGSSVTITDIQFIGNKSDALRLDGNAQATVNNSTFTGNVGYGVFANSSGSPIAALTMATAAFANNGGVIKIVPALANFKVSGPLSISNSGVGFGPLPSTCR